MIQRLFIANRGEITIRVARAANDLNVVAVGCYAKDDAKCLHVARVDEAVALPGSGAAAYLDIQAVVDAAVQSKCDAVHPGYGFLSESSEFAKACQEAGLTFVGPAPETLELFGNKANARELARKMDVPLLAGSTGTASLEDIKAYYKEHGAQSLMLKAIAGGGGRGMRVVHSVEELEEAYERCSSEAQAAFGKADLYFERFIPRARHIEVQMVGDGRSSVSLGERECTIQRRNQKLIEIAPSPFISETLRAQIIEAAEWMADKASLASLCTFEFLVDMDAEDGFFFMEANPRVQVEHTVTEEVFGFDLVKAQIAIAGGETLDGLGLLEKKTSQGYAVQLRINAETLTEAGEVKPSFGRVTTFEMPSGPGVRVDGCGYAGYDVSPNYDSLLAKVIVSSRDDDFQVALRRVKRALSDVRIEGISGNTGLLKALLERDEVAKGRADTRFVEGHAKELGLVGLVDQGFFASVSDGAVKQDVSVPDGMIGVSAHIGGVVSAVQVSVGDVVRPGAEVAVLESMKMEHLVVAEQGGVVREVLADVGAVQNEGDVLFVLEPADVDGEAESVVSEMDLDLVRPDLAEFIERTAVSLDENRPAAVAKRRKLGMRTARENVNDLFDDGSFVEYANLAIAAQRSRRSLDDLIANTPTDGVITGFGAINGDKFNGDVTRAAIVAYDYTVLAGTQGFYNHKKTDRILDQALQWKSPVIIYAEGGGGRPGDIDSPKVTGLDVKTFAAIAKCSGVAPMIGIVAGRCFAGNAALAGCCDVIIATENSNLGMSGPAMIEGGGLGVFRPEDIGPIDVQSGNGVVDIRVKDEVEATAVAKKYLSYFQGPLDEWKAEDQRVLRHIIPENRVRIYPVRDVIHGLFDKDSVLELRESFGRGIITVLARIEGRPVGVIANDPTHLGGAIDGDAADKSSRFMRLCNAYGLPIVSLIDTPGFMVGPDVEAEAQVRRVCRMYLAGARVTTPFISIVLRKGYGLGAQAMAAGGMHSPVQTVSWPTGEFGGMGFEGAVRLGFRKEMEAIEDDAEREAFFQEKVAKMYEGGKAINIASVIEIDGVIDPADTRAHILRLLEILPERKLSEIDGKPFIDTW